MPGYPTDLTNAQWKLLEPLVNVTGKRGRPFSGDVRRVIDGVLYITRTGCQWRCLPHEFGPWTRIWSQFRRWSRNGMWGRMLATLHQAARTQLGRAEPLPSMVVMDTHLARGASNGGATFHNKGGPYGFTNGAKRAIAVDVTGLPLAARVLPASTHENATTAALLADMVDSGQSERLELVLVDRGVSARGAHQLSLEHDLEVRIVHHGGPKGTFVPLPFAWRVEVTHGRLLRSRRLARSFENTLQSATGWLQVACIAAVLDAMAAAPVATVGTRRPRRATPSAQGSRRRAPRAA
jgi:putative transposase